MANEIIYALSSAPAKLDKESGLWRKELIYVGNFRKKESDGTIIQLNVEEEHLDHWAKTSLALSEAGFEIPLPVEHTTDPEKRRGTVVRMAKELNGAGLPALFGYIKFRDKEAEKLALSSNCSVYIEPKFSYNGSDYRQAITHVAITDYPVIPRLSKFAQAVALSMSSPPVLKGFKMSLATLAEKLGVPVADKDEAQIEAEIASMWQAQQAAIDALKQELASGDSTGDEDIIEEDDEVIAASLIDTVRENREMKIARLLDTGRITPAVATQLKTKFCADKPISLSLSKKAIDDGFKSTIELFSANEPVVGFRSRTSGQTAIALSNPLSPPQKNALELDAERRALAAKR